MTLGVALDPIPGVPSLLGRDFFGRFRLEFDMPENRLVIEQPSARSRQRAVRRVRGTRFRACASGGAA